VVMKGDGMNAHLSRQEWEIKTCYIDREAFSISTNSAFNCLRLRSIRFVLGNSGRSTFHQLLMWITNRLLNSADMAMASVFGRSRSSLVERG
jgi:hypothetical protein